MAKQLGFSIQAGRCVQCHACEVACKAANSVELGPKWRRVLSHWEGEYPQLSNIALSKSCMHCAKPTCLEACPAKAIIKRAEDGIIVVDSNKCIGCRTCEEACPYGAPQYGENGRMQKCDLCLGRLSRGKQPACVATCPGEALGFGEIKDLVKQIGAQQPQKLEGPTQPSFVIIPAYRGVQASAYVDAFFKS